MRQFKGFTLVELLLVLVILAVCTGGVAVSLKGRQEHYTLKASSKDLAEAIRYAAGESRLRELPHRIVFKNEKVFRVEKQRQQTVNEYVPVTGTAGRQNSLKGNIRIAGIFDPDGKGIMPVPECLVFDQTPDSFSGQICLQGDSNCKVRIYVNGFSGQVDIGE